MNEKQCCKCARVRTLDKFAKSSKMDDGLQLWCKDCYREHQEFEDFLQKIREGALNHLSPYIALLWDDGPFR